MALVRGFCPRTRNTGGSAPFGASVSSYRAGQNPASWRSEGRTLRPEIRVLRSLGRGRSSPGCEPFGSPQGLSAARPLESACSLSTAAVGVVCPMSN